MTKMPHEFSVQEKCMEIMEGLTRRTTQVLGLKRIKRKF